MTTMSKGSQLRIPGVDQAAIESLMQSCPKPETVEQAEKFIRSRGFFTLKYKEDVDIIKIGIKVKDQQEDQSKFEFISELPAYDKKRWNEKYIDAAHRLYYAWIEIEASKH